MLSLNNISKSFGARLLFDNVAFTLGARERVGLVGRNGHGKTTLLNIIAGLTGADTGSVTVPKGYKIGYIDQRADFGGKTAREWSLSLLPPDIPDYLALKALFGLGFTDELLSLPCELLSGGFQMRLALAGALIGEPHLLLLDEPTNYLDILSVRWLRTFLTRFNGEVMLITHDRAFMDSVCTHIAGIHRGKIKKVAGNTEKYYAGVALEEEVYEKTRLNEEAKRRDMEEFISRFRAKARLANLVQSRVKTLAKKESRERLEKLAALEFSFRYKSTVSKTALQAEELTFGFDKEKPLIKNLSFTLNKGDRLCVVGRNGAGKSTLLRLLSGGMPPDSGRVFFGSDMGVFLQQGLSALTESATIEEEVAAASNYALERSAVRGICAAFLFGGDDALKRIGVLSGGERARVNLAKTAAAPATCLILDEPTNHLDMDASDALLEALLEFEGALCLVSHNEAFLSALATRLIVFQGETPYLFEGSYSEFLEKVGWDSPLLIEESASSRGKNSKKEERRKRAEEVQRRAKELAPLARRVERLEGEITLLEEELKRDTEELSLATEEGDVGKITLLSVRIGEAEKKVDLKFEELDAASKEYDRALQGEASSL